MHYQGTPGAISYGTALKSSATATVVNPENLHTEFPLFLFIDLILILIGREIVESNESISSPISAIPDSFP